jgi:hypothetical protein
VFKGGNEPAAHAALENTARELVFVEERSAGCLLVDVLDDIRIAEIERRRARAAELEQCRRAVPWTGGGPSGLRCADRVARALPNAKRACVAEFRRISPQTVTALPMLPRWGWLHRPEQR